MAAKFKACSVDGCKVNAHSGGSGGWCHLHYMRWRRHGDPLKGRTADGEPPHYFRDVVLSYEGDECLKWPYAKSSSGYGKLWVDGRLQVVARLICERVNGPPPTPEHEAAHSCGNGHEGCVTKRHLSWKTPKENSTDQLVHGTRLRGSRQNGAKLTEDHVREIRGLKGKMLQREIAVQFGISQRNISNIHAGKIWAHLTPLPE